MTLKIYWVPTATEPADPFVSAGLAYRQGFDLFIHQNILYTVNPPREANASVVIKEVGYIGPAVEEVLSGRS